MDKKEQASAGKVDLDPFLFRGWNLDEAAEHEGYHPEWKSEKKDRPPAKKGDEKAGQRGACRDGDADDGRVQPQDFSSLFRWKGRGQKGRAGRDHHGSTEGLEDAKKQEKLERWGEATEKGEQAEDGKASNLHPKLAV